MSADRITCTLGRFHTGASGEPSNQLVPLAPAETAPVEPPTLALLFQLLGDLLKRHEVAAQVEAMLSEEPAPTSRDTTADALAAYAEGVHDTLAALDAWALAPDTIGHSVREWVAAHRATAPVRPMTALALLERFEAWDRSEATDPTDLRELLNRLRREIEGP